MIESFGDAYTGTSLGALAHKGTLVKPGYCAGRNAHIDVTDFIWKRACILGFALAAQSPAAKLEAWNQVMMLVARGAVVPVVERTYSLEQAAEAQKGARVWSRLCCTPTAEKKRRHVAVTP